MKPLRHYIYEGGKVKLTDLLGWAIWMEAAERRLRVTHIGDVRISTVFFGLDHSFTDNAVRPVLWETMIFVADKMPDPHKLAGEMTRYQTKEQALRGHEVFVERVREFYPQEAVAVAAVNLGERNANYDTINKRIREKWETE